MNKDIAEGVALASMGGCAMLTIYDPSILGNNKFLCQFVTHEIMSFLIVILTITLASVANIHLSMTEALQRGLEDKSKRAKIEAEVGSGFRAEINSSAWLLFWAFVVCAISLLIKGAFSENLYVLSLVHGLAVTVVIVNLLVLYDIYQTIYAMAGTPPPLHDNENGDPTNSQGNP